MTTILRINNKGLEFNNVYYVDSVNGNDSYDGSEEKPFKTIVTAYSACNQTDDAIFIKGEHTLSTKIQFTKDLSMIGDYLKFGSKIILSAWGLLNFRYADTTIQKFYGIYFYTNNTLYEMFIGNAANETPYGNPEFYNCVLHQEGTTDGHQEIGGVASAKFYNCARSIGNTFLENAAYSGRIQYVNCADQYTTVLGEGSGTIDCLNSVVFDNQFNITSGVWENVLDSQRDPDLKKGSVGIYGGPFAWGEWPPVKAYFIYDNDVYKTYDSMNNIWVDQIVSTPLTEDDYIDKGMRSLDTISSTAFSSLVDPKHIQLYQYSTYKYESDLLDIQAIPKQQLILPIKDIDISMLDKITSITFNGVFDEFGVIKCIVSFDTGISWWGFNSTINEFVKVGDLTSASYFKDVDKYGILCSEINLIDYEKLNILKEKSETIRIAYYLNTSSINTSIAIDTLSIIGNLKGAWVNTSNSDYNYTVGMDKITVKLKTAGSYKINFFNQNIAMYVYDDAVQTGITSWNELIDKPTVYPAMTHKHAISEITDLVNQLDDKSDVDHIHDAAHIHDNKSDIDKISEVDNLPYIDGKPWPGVFNKYTDTYISLFDTSDIYTGFNNAFLRVKNDGSGLEFVNLNFLKSMNNVTVPKKQSIRYSFLYGGG